MSILFARISYGSAVFSACALILCWAGRSLAGTHEKVIVAFAVAFSLSSAAVVTGILAILRSHEARERRIAWIGTISGFILLLPIGAVAVIFLIILF